jgi:hypothetical protein
VMRQQGWRRKGSESTHTDTPVQLRARPEIIESTFDRVRYGFTTDFPYHILWW